jgi:hypothetical protein
MFWNITRRLLPYHEFETQLFNEWRKFILDMVIRIQPVMFTITIFFNNQ